MILPLTLVTLLLPLLLLIGLPRVRQSLRPYLAAAPAMLAFLGVLFCAWTEIRSGEAVTWRVSWFPSLDIDLEFMMGGWGLLMCLLVLGVGACIMVYLFGYEENTKKQMKLYGNLSMFMFAMAGLTMSDNLILLFIFWELTSIISYLLVGFYNEKPESRRNALQALLITGSGGMCLLAGLIMLATAGESWKISELITRADLIHKSTLYTPLTLLIIIGAFTKSAQFPFHFWLPNAMVAPTPISAYLHSATMVKAGVFLLALLNPIIGGSELWTMVLCSAGLITLILGGIFGLAQSDMKAILAGTTLSVLGLLTFLIGLNTEKSLLAMCLFIVGHALYKACLFMVAGIVDKVTGTRDVRLLGGVRHLLPFTASVAMVAALSKMGMIPFFGFIGKEYVYKAALYNDSLALSVVLIVGNAIIFALATKACVLPFFRPQIPLERPLTPPALSMLISPAVLAGFGLLFGLLPQLLAPLIHCAVDTISVKSSDIKIVLWAGVNLPLLMSGITILLGILISFNLNKLHALFSWKGFTPLSPNAAYQRIHDGLLHLAKSATSLLQGGYLRNYLLIIITSTFTLVAWKLSLLSELPEIPNTLPLNYPIIVISVLMLISTILAVTTKSKLVSLIMLGVVGFGVALYFAVYSAPDLAITQILVETLIVVIFAWVIRKVGSYHFYTSRKTRLMDASIAITFGGMVSLLVLKSKALELSSSISSGLTEMSYPEGKGANVVNVTLVDFRAFDTLGEITVLTIAAIGVWALLNQLSPNKKSS